MSFKNIYIIGNGVMGKLLHKRIEKFYDANVVMFDKEDKLSSENIEEGKHDNPNLIIIATPISTIPVILHEINDINPSWTYICEIGSVKGDLVKEYYKIIDSGTSTMYFESVHPMVGPLATDWEILNWNKPCIIIQQDMKKAPEQNLIAKFWRDLGFVIRRMEPKQHDKVVGKLSHLSHFMIMAYVDLVNKTLKPEELSLAGPSFEKFKDLAQGAKRLNDIYINNVCMDDLIVEFSKHMRSLHNELK